MTKERTLDRRLCVAPMMDWTDRHCRYFLRQLSRHTLLYTEMVTTGAILHGDRARFLAYHPGEKPVAIQLGGSNPKDLAACAKFAEAHDYDEVNLNVGCPSDRVQEGRIGACLMAEPQTVADCMKAMQDTVDIPVTIKHRIGINGRDSWQELCDFIGTVAETGCETFIVHARIAILEGLNPKENREIPPLKYDVVYKLKETFPDLEIIINGGIQTLADTQEHLKHIDGVMIGREAYNNPYILAAADQQIFNRDVDVTNRYDALEAMYPYIEQEMAQGVRLNHVTRHMLGLFQGLPGARRFRRHLSENAHRPEASVETLKQAAALVSRDH